MKKLKNKNYVFLMICACLFLHEPLFAEERLTIGVAANFMLPFQEICLEEYEVALPW